jgi:hypothetical protein
MPCSLGSLLFFAPYLAKDGLCAMNFAARHPERLGNERSSTSQSSIRQRSFLAVGAG